MKDKRVLIVMVIALIGISIVGSTYAYLTMSLNINNANYTNVGTHCFGVTYNVNNTDGETDITGTLFPSGTPTKGLSGRVGFSSDPICATTGLGTINLNVANTTSTTLTTPASSYCEDRSTLEPISGISTESACATAGGRWRGYGDSYCENPNTLERLPDYTTELDCTTHSGSWTTPGSPLKYAIYTSTETNAQPVSVGRINTTDIGNTITIYNNFAVTGLMSYYYIYIWLDGYLTDNTHTNLPFSANITASVSQNPNATPVESTYVYTINMADEAYVVVGQPIPNEVTQYQTPDAAMNALTARFLSDYGIDLNDSNATEHIFQFLRHTIQNGVVVTSDVGFSVTDGEINSGTYYLRGYGHYQENKITAQNVYGEHYDWYCSEFNNPWQYVCNHYMVILAVNISDDSVTAGGSSEAFGNRYSTCTVDSYYGASCGMH